MKRVAFYGSLKEGYWNHSRFNLEKDKRHENGVVTGSMYRSGMYDAWFPYLFEQAIDDSINDREHVVEVYEIDDDKYDMIRRMEENSGYHESTVMVNGEECNIFFADKYMLDHLKKRGIDLWVDKYELPDFV